jgi:predicted alpha/beta hydrolase family esterase
MSRHALHILLEHCITAYFYDCGSEYIHYQVLLLTQTHVVAAYRLVQRWRKLVPEESYDDVTFVPLDLQDHASLVAAMQGCAAVVHTAGPFQVSVELLLTVIVGYIREYRRCDTLYAYRIC